MSFFIKEVRLISTKGEDKDASVQLQNGVNFIIGPSNTGKSLIIECIDYCFGYVHKDKKKTNYAAKIEALKGEFYAVSVTVASDQGEITIRRNIGDNKQVYIDGALGSHPCKINGKNNLGNTLLYLIGIQGPHKIRAAKKVTSAPNAVTWRGIEHFFLVRQANINTMSSILYNPESKNPETSSHALFLFLLTGKNADDFEKQEDPKIKNARTEGQRQLLEEELRQLSKRYEELKGLKEQQQDTSVADDIERQISIIQIQINDAIMESRNLMNQIYVENSRLSEGNVIHRQFEALKSQYESDIKRMSFIVEGEHRIKQYKANKVCPLCGSPVNAHDLSFPRQSRTYSV